MNRPVGYIDVDRLQAETTLEAAAAKCGVPLDVKGAGSEVRIDCLFGCAGDHQGRKEIAINTDNPQKVFQCHSYQCQFRGNLLTLMHGFLTGTKPTGGKLKSDEFQRVKKVLAGIGSPTVSRKALAAGSSELPASSTTSPSTKTPATSRQHPAGRSRRRTSPRAPQHRRETQPRRRNNEPHRRQLHPPAPRPFL